MGLELENLGANVGVQPGELGPGTGRQVLQHRFELVGIKTKLAVEVAGADVLMGVALNTRRKPQHQLHGSLQVRGQGSQQLKIAPVVSHHRDALLSGEGQLFAALVVAVQHDALRRHAPLQGGEQLASRNRIKPQAFGCHQGSYGQGAIRLGGVDG